MDKELARKPLYAKRERKKLPFLLSAFGLIGVALAAVPPLLHTYNHRPSAIMFPVVGSVYLRNVTQDVIDHEECHNKRRLEVGDIAYYVDYMLRPAREEKRCGAPHQHPAFSYPFQPAEDIVQE